MSYCTDDDREILEWVARNDPNGSVREPMPEALARCSLQHERIMVALAREALDLSDYAQRHP